MPLSPHLLESAVRPKSQEQKGPRRCPGSGMRPIKVAFNHIKATIAREVVLAYPDFSKVFEIYTDTSSKQMGAVLTQENRPIVFFSRKLSTTQCKYSVTKIELLAIVETLKGFKGMLWGQSIKVYTNHANLIRDALGMTSDCVYQCRLLLKEYWPEIVYIKGIHNTIANAISRLEYDLSMNRTAENYHMTKVKKKEFKTQSETKLDDSLKTLVQSRNRHQQTQRFNLCVC